MTGIGHRLDAPREECGVVAVHMPRRDAARIAFFALHTLQHRGQEAAGIVSTAGGVAHVHKGQGLVSGVFFIDQADEALITILETHRLEADQTGNQLRLRFALPRRP